MLNEKVLEYAIKGINAEIAKLEKNIKQGQEYLKQYENGEKPKTNKTPYEIQAIIKAKKEEIENLLKDEADIKWQLAALEEK